MRECIDVGMWGTGFRFGFARLYLRIKKVGVLLTAKPRLFTFKLN